MNLVVKNLKLKLQKRQLPE